jgi:hypothetical protein
MKTSLSKTVERSNTLGAVGTRLGYRRTVLLAQA